MRLSVKRGLDVMAAGALLCVLSPLLIVVAAAIKMDSPGPVFYRGRRTGLLGVPFSILKFRTMVVDAESGGTSTAMHDPRVTRVGRWIRGPKLDELPQLVNVLRGEMSFVGPRPEVEEHTAAYTEEEREALSVVPGITDLSSVYFFRLNELVGSENAHDVFVTQYRETKNRLRVEYARTRSAWLDISILVATVTCVLTGGRWVLKLSPQIRAVAR